MFSYLSYLLPLYDLYQAAFLLIALLPMNRHPLASHIWLAPGWHSYIKPVVTLSWAPQVQLMLRSFTFIRGECLNHKGTLWALSLSQAAIVMNMLYNLKENQLNIHVLITVLQTLNIIFHFWAEWNTEVHNINCGNSETCLFIKYHKLCSSAHNKFTSHELEGDQKGFEY